MQYFDLVAIGILHKEEAGQKFIASLEFFYRQRGIAQLLELVAHGVQIICHESIVAIAITMRIGL